MRGVTDPDLVRSHFMRPQFRCFSWTDSGVATRGNTETRPLLDPGRAGQWSPERTLASDLQGPTSDARFAPQESS